MLDPRTNAYRPDLAASSLRGKIEAARFADATVHRIADPHAAVRREPRHDAALETEALFGERFMAYEINSEGWAWGQLGGDRYVGYVAAGALGRAGPAPTHRVMTTWTLGFPGANIKLPPAITLPMGAQFVVTNEDETFAQTDGGLFIPRRHIAPIDGRAPDFVAVAERLLCAPYLWGGKTALGIDCSGLVQVSLQMAGVPCPRDSDMQQQALGKPVGLEDLRRGDLLFWKGHVAIARDPQTIVHANAFHMAVAIEPAAEAIARIEAAGSSLLEVKRL
ncbi:MAG: NLP/P60 family lipoprotein [Pseudolabrys sp.]|jgi:cell wall-associated NlpC family hydrolase|nr:NLP/P60 family lipoprotein [Pseudolabrys sp.]